MEDKGPFINRPASIAGKLDYISIISLMLMLFFVPLVFYRNEYIWTKTAVIYLFLFPAITMYFLKSVLRKGIDFFYTPVIIPVILLDIIAGLSAFHAYNTNLSLQMLVKQAAYQAPFFLFIYYAKDIKIRTVTIIVTIVSVIISAYGLMQFFHVIPSPLDQWGRPNPASTMGLTNFTTDYLVMVIPLMLTAFLTEPNKKLLKYGAYMGILLSLSYIIIGRNRAGWVALAVTMVFYAIMFGSYKSYKKISNTTKRLFIYTGTAAIVSLIALMAFTQTGSGLLRRGESIFNKDYSSNAFRIVVWNSTLNGIKANPAFGVGIGNYQINIPLYESKALKNTDWTELRYLNSAHNDYLQILFELGIVGFALFLWFIVEIFIAGAGGIRDAKGELQSILWNTALLAGIGSALVTAFFTFNLENPASAMMFWIFAGLLVGKRRYRHFEDEYGFISNLKKLSGFKWRWKYDLQVRINSNYMITAIFIIIFVLFTILFGNLAFFSHRHEMASIYNMEAETYLDLNMPKKAKEVIDKAYALVPNDYLVLYTLARSEAGSMNTADAIINAKKAISLAPYFSYAHKLLGFLYYNKDNYAGAINEFHSAINFLPLSIREIGPYLVSSYLSTNDIDSGISLAIRLLNQKDKNGVYNFLLGTAYYMKADYSNAIKYLKKAVEKNPSDFNAVLNLTESLQKTNDLRDALNYAIRLTKLKPANPAAWYTLAGSYILLHNEKGAFAALAKLFKLNPSYKMIVVNDNKFAKLLNKPRMKKLLSGDVFIPPPHSGRRR